MEQRPLSIYQAFLWLSNTKSAHETYSLQISQNLRDCLLWIAVTHKLIYSLFKIWQKSIDGSLLKWAELLLKLRGGKIGKSRTPSWILVARHYDYLRVPEYELVETFLYM